MNTVLDVAIGLFFVFLLFSLFVNAINEAIFGHLTHLRSRVLEDSLHAILSKEAKDFPAWAWLRRGFKAPPSSGARVFSEDLLKHPLVQGLVVGRHRCPNYLPAETFVDAPLGTLLNLGTAQASPPGSPEFDRITISDLADAVNQLSDNQAKKVFSSVLTGSADLQEARQRLEAWFNNSMERVSGIYKRYPQFWLYIWATAIVIWLNVDTIEIIQRLLADAQFRGTLAAGAASFVAQANASNAVVAVGSNRPPSAASSTNATDLMMAQPNSAPMPMSPAELLQEITKLNLPIGWSACTTNAGTDSIIGW